MFAPPPLRRTLEASFRDLASASADVRQSAIVDLATHELPAGERTRAICELARLLAGDSGAAVRSAAAVALADFRAHEAVPQLLLAVEDDHGHVRQMALSALGEIGEISALPRVERALSDARPEVRYQATIAFFRLCSDEARKLEVLLQKLGEDDDAIRYIALRLGEEHLVHTASAGALLDAAAARLDDEAAEVAVAAAVILGNAGDARGFARLREVVHTGAVAGVAVPKEDEVEAIELVGRLGFRDLVGTLERRAFGLARLMRDTCSLSAKVALARMGDVRAIQSLAQDLESSSTDRRTLAIVAAGRTGRAELRDVLRAASRPLDRELVAEALARLEREIDADLPARGPQPGTELFHSR